MVGAPTLGALTPGGGLRARVGLPPSAAPSAGTVVGKVVDTDCGSEPADEAGITGDPGTTTVGNDETGPPDWGAAVAGGRAAAVGWCTSGLPRWMAPVRAAT